MSGPLQSCVDVVVDWPARLSAEGGAHCNLLTVKAAEPYLPWPLGKCYRMADAYIVRMERERKRRHSYLLPLDVTYALDGELPALRDGRSVLLYKQLLVVKLLGYLPEVTS